MRKNIILLFLFFISPVFLLAQKQKADSLYKLLVLQKQDTARVKILWQLADEMNGFSPDSAIIFAQKALFLSKELNYKPGQSKAFGALAISFRKIGNYSKALEYNLLKLKLAEKEENPANLASSLLSIGVVYRYQEEYLKALEYYYKSNSVIQKYNLVDQHYYIMMNLGDVYDKLNNSDSAFNYFNKALIISISLNNDDYIGNAMTGLGHTYRKMRMSDFSKLNYLNAVKHLLIANDDEVLCEAYLGLAKLFSLDKLKIDSAIHYARLSNQIAEKASFINWQLDAAEFLTALYKDEKKIDSAFVYMNKVHELNDSLNSKGKIKQILLISSNETLRQLELAEAKAIAAKERKMQLQYLFIGIFIPGFFLFTLLLSRIKIHTRIIKILGILSLLILFEYLLLLLHPRVAEFTHHNPIYEMLIFVTVAAVLVPGHHRFEHWLIEKLTHKKGSVQLKKIRFKVKVPPTV